MVGGAWPFLVGGVICLVYSDNERDSNLLNSYQIYWVSVFVGLLFSSIATQTLALVSDIYFLEGQAVFSRMKLSNNRSVMPLDVQGCTRATLRGISVQ